MKNAALILVALSFLSISACRRDADRATERDVEDERTGKTTRIEETEVTGRATPGTDTQPGVEQRTDRAIDDLSGDETGLTPASRVEQRKAEADFKAATGIKLDGDADLVEMADGVHVSVEIDNAPVGTKAIHVHQKGDCSDVAGKSMGDHWNPEGKSHGLPGSKERHAGDLGNITINKDGKSKFEAHLPGVNLKPNDRMSLVGKALVIHASKDVGTQPSGGAGTPIACAVIEAD